MATILYVSLDGVDKSSKAIGANVVLKTVNQGHCTFNAVLDNNDQTLNGLYDSEDLVHIQMGGADIIKGYIDDVAHSVSHTESTWHHLLRVSGRDYSQDLSNLFISKVWASAKKADEILDEALARVLAEITYAAPATGPTIGGYEPHQQYLMDLFKDVLDRANWEAYVDGNKVLQAFALDANSSGVTLTYADLVGNIEYTEKTGLGLRNQIYGLGDLIATTTADEYTDALAGWTSDGALSLDAGSAEGAWCIQALKVGGPPAEEYMDHDIPYAVSDVSATCHFWIWSFGFTAAPVAANEVYLLLIEDSTNYFRYDFAEAAIATGLTEFSLGIGRDNEASWTRGGFPDWAGINKIRFNAKTTTETDIYCRVDGLNFLNVNYGGYSSDATSRTTYRRRMELQQDSMLASHTQALDLSDSILEKKKDPLEHIKLTVNGASSIVGGAYKFLPGYTVTLNFPKIGMTNEVWRIETATLKCYPYQDISGHGHDFTVELSCVPQTTKIDHLELASIAKARSALPLLSKEAFKRRSRRTWLP